MIAKTKTHILILIDINGSRKLLKNSKSSDMFLLLQRFYDICGNALTGKQTRIIKFIGDSVLCISDPSNIKNPLSDFRDAYNAINTELSKIDIHLNISMKLHKGEATVGLLGYGKDKRFDIIGESVNDLFLLKGDGFVTSDAF